MEEHGTPATPGHRPSSLKLKVARRWFGWCCCSTANFLVVYGLARCLPRSSRRYTAENSVDHGAPRNTDNPELGNHWLLKFGSLLKSKLIQVRRSRYLPMDLL